MSLASVTRFVVGSNLVRETEKQLRRAGRDGYELFVLWSGKLEGRRFVVRNCHVPKQTSYKLESGLCVKVEGEALHKLNAWLYRHQQVLGAQVHAHPASAYHSETDDAYPIVTVVGGLSIVAADFCRASLFDSSSAVYRLEDGVWVEQPLSIVEVF